MKLYTYFRSSAAYRVRIALNLKKLPYESIPKALTKGEHQVADYIVLNPQGFVPALQIDDAVLSQSLAIIEYLDERYPEPPLLPAAPIARAQVRSIALAIVCDIHPLNNLRVLNYLRGELGENEDAVTAWYRHWVIEGFRAVELQVRRHSTSGRFCFADSISIADVCLVPQVFNARRFHVPVDAYPTLLRADENATRLEPFESAHPDRQEASK